MDYWRVKNINITVFGHKNGTCFQETIFIQDAALWFWISCVLQIWIFDSKQSRVHLLLQSDTLKYGSEKRYLANLTLRKVIRIALKGWPSSQCCSEIGNYVGLVIWQKYSNSNNFGGQERGWWQEHLSLGSYLENATRFYFNGVFQAEKYGSNMCKGNFNMFWQ